MASKYDAQALAKHKEHQGKLGVRSRIDLKTQDDLSVAYTPGVAAVSQHVSEDPQRSYEYTWRGRTVAIVSDGSAVLGLGNIGPEGALPVMEGKAAIMFELAGIDGVPLVVDTQDAKEIIQFVRHLVPSFGAVNLEDISAPRCFEIEEALQDCGIPVFHDDQHGTALVCLGALINGLQRVGKGKDVRVVINGAGSAGIAIARLLKEYGIAHLTLCDSKGIVGPERMDINEYKQQFASTAQPKSGSMKDAIKGADVFIGVSKGNLLTAEDIATMSQDALAFCMANPTPELPPEEAQKATNLAIYATGRSDLPNQINNAAVYPGLYKGLLQAKAKQIDRSVFIRVAERLAELATDSILPAILDPVTHDSVAAVVKEYYDAANN